MILSPNCVIYRKSILEQNGSGGTTALSIQPAQQFSAVLTGILPSKVAVMGTKTLNHRGRRGAQRKTFSAAVLH
jgi:hypothetical protein